jgi:hypothetical protein
MAGRLGTKGRFATAYLALGAIVGVGIGSFLVLLQRQSPQPPPPWSSWRPTAADTNERMLEIANHVGKTYRLPSGDQLVAIQTQNDSSNFQGVVVVKPDDVRQLDAQYGSDDTAVYLLCGDPKTCKIEEGEATIARGTVLRREALELALYTLEYARPIDNVLVFFPPSPGAKSLSSTLFFKRDDLSGSLDHPLRKTLPQAQPPLPGKIHPAELKTVNDLTGDKRYKYLGTSQNVIVIQPPA